MFGTQELSHRPSPPAFGFGSSTRGNASKLFIGAEHAKTYNYGSDTPGPRYNSISAVGTQQEGGKNSNPQWRFGTDERFGVRRKAESPGPGAHETDSAIGKQLYSARSTFPRYGFGTGGRTQSAKLFISAAHASSDYGAASPGPAYINNCRSSLASETTSEYSSAPKYGFGTAERFSRVAQKLGSNWDTPGPAGYDTSAGTTGVGVQQSSRVVSQPSFGFGSSTRHQRSRLFVSDGHSRSNGGAHACSPGPAVYPSTSSIGSQYSTRGHTSPGWGFSKASRFRTGSDDTGTPGPGAYAI